MPFQNASRCLRSACLIVALTLPLVSCSSPQVVVKTVPVEIPVPVVKPLPREITADCPPRFLYPDDDVTVEAVIDRLIAVEIALGICRNNLELVRASQP